MRELIIFHWKGFTAKCYHFVGGGQTLILSGSTRLHYCFSVHIGSNLLSFPLGAKINLSPQQAYTINPWNVKPAIRSLQINLFHLC